MYNAGTTLKLGRTLWVAGAADSESGEEKRIVCPIFRASSRQLHDQASGRSSQCRWTGKYLLRNVYLLKEQNKLIKIFWAFRESNIGCLKNEDHYLLEKWKKKILQKGY